MFARSDRAARRPLPGPSTTGPPGPNSERGWLGGLLPREAIDHRTPEYLFQIPLIPPFQSLALPLPPPRATQPRQGQAGWQEPGLQGLSRAWAGEDRRGERRLYEEARGWGGGERSQGLGPGRVGHGGRGVCVHGRA